MRILELIKYVNSQPELPGPHLGRDVIAVVDRFIKSNRTLKKFWSQKKSKHFIN